MSKLDREKRLFSGGCSGALFGLLLMAAGALKQFPLEKVYNLDANQLSVVLGVLAVAIGATVAARAVTRR